MQLILDMLIIVEFCSPVELSFLHETEFIFVDLKSCMSQNYCSTKYARIFCIYVKLCICLNNTFSVYSNVLII